MTNPIRITNSDFTRIDGEWFLNCPACPVGWNDPDKGTLIDLFHQHVSVVHPVK